MHRLALRVSPPDASRLYRKTQGSQLGSRFTVEAGCTPSMYGSVSSFRPYFTRAFPHTRTHALFLVRTGNTRLRPQIAHMRHIGGTPPTHTETTHDSARPFRLCLAQRPPRKPRTCALEVVPRCSPHSHGSCPQRLTQRLAHSHPAIHRCEPPRGHHRCNEPPPETG